ncbi:Protein BREAST CANCER SUSCEPTIBILITY 1 [Choanephora cucurbitarum]|uniref:Protein BREAST CANCER SUSCEPTIBILITY 1 n=1 Tax=Choanephora cucurbitarum TaxID=101091 RepID=A0A1C7NLP6_9FUNG|nr:Protein BREAST CANCER SUSCEPTIBILITY 1 [Choanephora cucurbitarum]
MSVEDLEPDQRLSNLVIYVEKLKQQLMDQNLTPLEFTMVSRKSCRQEEAPLLESTELPKKRPFSQEDVSESSEEVDELESEFSDSVISKKRLKAQMSEDDPMALNSDPSVPGATLGLSSAEQTQESIREEEDEEEELERPPANTIAEASVVDDGRASKSQWQCSSCHYKNAAYVQTCGVCRAFKAHVTPTVPSTVEEPPSNPTYELTMAVDKDNQSVHATQQQKQTNTNTHKEAHILYTGLTPEDEKALEKIKKEAEKSKLRIFIHYQMREFHEITHIVTSVNKQRLCKRTMKYLQGILAGKWIVDPGWLLDSVKENEWQTEEHYQVQGDHLSGVTLAPAKGREHMHKPLFEQLSFYLNGGAKIISRKPTTTTADKDSTLVVIVPEGYKRKKTSAWLDAYPVKDPVWLIHCISTFEVTI